MPADVNFIQARLAALRERFSERGLDAFLAAGPENRRYLSGFTAADPQWGMLLITAADAFLLTDFRYETWALDEAPDYEIMVYKTSLGDSLKALLDRAGVRSLGFDAAHLTYLQYQRLIHETAEPSRTVEWKPITGLAESLREVKSPEELAVMRRALALTEAVFTQVADSLKPGLTERQVAWDIERRLREQGAEGLAFPPIVASGPNSARPHHHPGDYRLQEGEPIIIDMGAKVDGYCADFTRTVILGEPDEQFRRIYAIVRQAQARAEAHLRAGLTSLEADALAREVIARAGYGEAFGHSLGHGVGLAVHETPRLSPNPEKPPILRAGSVTTVEPGIYLTGWGGVRLEDMVLLHPERAEVLNGLREFYEW
jgi:Xaa-Pro aminopeptidase